MKEQDYMNIMGTIRGEYLAEAVSWDGSERRRIRQIRRMTVSFGAVAAALAVVIGMIAYKANKDRIEIANSVPESSIVSEPDESSTGTVTEQETNLFGGHGELRRIRDMLGENYYDDEYLYLGMNKVSLLQSGKYIPTEEGAYPAGLMSDGRTLFRQHDGKLFETDSFGNETELMDLADYQFPNAAENAQILSTKKISEQMLVILYGQPDWSDAQRLVIDLQGKKALKMNQGLSGLSEISATSFYAIDYADGALYRITLNNGELLEENVLGPIYTQDEEPVGVDQAKLDGKNLYMIVREESFSDGDPATWHVVRDLATGKMVKTEIPKNQNVYLGSALIRMAVEDGRFTVYRSDPDLSNEIRILYLPFAEYLGTQAGTPDLRLGGTVSESEELVLLHLPVTDSAGNRIPTLHGEEEIIIDLRTGKTVFTGEHYDDGTEPEAETAAPVTVTAAEITTTAAAASLTTETSAVTTAVTKDPMTDDQRKAIAKELINRYCDYYEGYAYGGLQRIDTNDQKEVTEPTAPDYKHRYDRVLSMNSVAEVKRKLAEAAAGQAYDDLAGIVDGAEGTDFQTPIYREFDGKLYLLKFGKGAQFMEWLWDSLSVTAVTENGFSVSLRERNSGDMINIYHFDFTDVKDGSENSFRVSHVISESTDEVLTH